MGLRVSLSPFTLSLGLSCSSPPPNSLDSTFKLNGPCQLACAPAAPLWLQGLHVYLCPSRAPVALRAQCMAPFPPLHHMGVLSLWHYLFLHSAPLGVQTLWSFTWSSSELLDPPVLSTAPPLGSRTPGPMHSPSSGLSDPPLGTWTPWFRSQLFARLLDPLLCPTLSPWVPVLPVL